MASSLKQSTSKICHDGEKCIFKKIAQIKKIMLCNYITAFNMDRVYNYLPLSFDV